MVPKETSSQTTYPFPTGLTSATESRGNPTNISSSIQKEGKKKEEGPFDKRRIEVRDS